MKISTTSLYSLLIENLSNIDLLPKDMFPSWDAIDIENEWLESGWNIKNVLYNPNSPNQSPYFWRGYRGIPMRMHFYQLCFFTFLSGVMFSVIKNGNIRKDWNYWQMHKYMGPNLILQSALMETAISNWNNLQMDIACGDMDLEGIQMYSLVHWIINNYFPHIGVTNFAIVDEDGIPVDYPIENLADVLATFHRFGAACFAVSLIDVDDCRLRGKRIWGGQGMSQIFDFY